jgi:hypothetical protein
MSNDKELIGTRTPDGAYLGGSSTDKVGFFGATPVVRQTAATAVGTAYQITAASTDGTSFGLDSSASMALLCNDVKAMHTALTNLGVMA